MATSKEKQTSAGQTSAGQAVGAQTGNAMQSETGFDGSVAAIFHQMQLSSLLAKEAEILIVHRTEDLFGRSYTNKDGVETPLPDQSLVHVSGGRQLIVVGIGLKEKGVLPAEGQAIMATVDTIVRVYDGSPSVKYFLRKWREISDVLHISTGNPIGMPLRYPAQFVSSTTVGQDFNIPSAQTEEEIEAAKRERSAAKQKQAGK